MVINSIYDIIPERFYLLSSKNRKLFCFESTNHILEEEIERAFAKFPIIEGGNIYALYKYSPSVKSILYGLSERFKDNYPQVQQLLAFFKNFNDGDFFIKQNSSVSLPNIKRSIIKIKALTNNYDISKADRIFVLNWCFLYLKYETYSYGFLTDKVYMGEALKDKRQCRFCGKSGAERFKNLSHAILDSLGNKSLFCLEECDECNKELEKHVEKHLYKFLEIPRTLACVKGKKSRRHHLEGLNFHIHPDEKTQQPIVYVMQEKIVNDVYQEKLTGKIYLYNKESISSQGIYKALVKIAVDMIPNEKISHFYKTGRWVHGDFEAPNFLPPVLYGEHDDFFEQPVLDLFFKNEKSPRFSPYCTAILYIFSSIFIYAVPFNDIDGDKYEDIQSFDAHWAFFKEKQYLCIKEWTQIDSNDKELITPFYKLPIFPFNNEYKVLYRPTSDNVFKRKQK